MRWNIASAAAGTLWLQLIVIIFPCYYTFRFLYPSTGFSSSYVWMWELDCEESCAPKNWCFWTVVLEKLLRVVWTARRSSQSILKEISLNIHWKDRCWSWSSNTSATWCKEPTHWKRHWFFLKTSFIYSFLAMLGPCCCARALCSCSAQASNCHGFSC